MGSIRLLDDALVDQIAAGEVVERPSSVVKELLDNAVDAGATAITVEISEGGRELIRVTDDGKGMDRSDAELCVRRHATSKIRRFEDFSTLTTMGFRGEALASIASVSRFVLTTRQRDAIAGLEVATEGGKEPTLREVGAPPGTSVEVRDLFFNVPARRKFLKARQTENHHVGEACLRTALAHPSLRISFISNGRRVREYLPAANRLARAKSIFNDQALVAIDGEHDGVALVAALGGPKRARSGTKHLYLFVNGRPIVDRALARAIAFAYGDALQPGRYPTGAVFLELPTSEVDINAHPQKTEVRFAKASRVVEAVTRVISKALGTRSWGQGITGTAAKASVPAGPAARSNDFWQERLAPGPSTAKEGPAEDHWGLDTAIRDEAPAYEPAPKKTAPAKPPKKTALTYVGKVGGAWLARRDKVLLVIDPPRAARVLILHSWSGTPLTTRRLLFPERIELDDDDAAAVQSARDELLALGLECAFVGPRTLAVHTLPQTPTKVITEIRATDVLRAALGAIELPWHAQCDAVATACSLTIDPSCAQAVIGELSALDAEQRDRVMVQWSVAQLLERLR